MLKKKKIIINQTTYKPSYDLLQGIHAFLYNNNFAEYTHHLTNTAAVVLLDASADTSLSRWGLDSQLV